MIRVAVEGPASSWPVNEGNAGAPFQRSDAMESASLLHELVLKGVARDFHVTLQAGLLLDPGEIRGDRLVAQGKFRRDLLHRPAHANQAEDVQFTVGKLLVQRFFAPGLEA